jgi:NADPH2:quinone reductase
MRAIQVMELGDPEVLRVVDVPSPRPSSGQLVAHPAAIGVNFTDIYARSGASRSAVPTPFTLGSEGAGTVTSLGEDVEGFRVGDRVAWKHAHGGYADEVLIDAREAVPVPANLTLEDAAAVMLQGITAHYLTTSTYAVQDGDIALVHAASGGAGLLITQMIRFRGGSVIATVSTAEKAALAAHMGADHIIRYDRDDVASTVRTISADGVAVVYDGVGRTTFDSSRLSLRTRGCLVLFGMSSGAVPSFDLQQLRSGSLFVTRPTVGDYTRTREELTERTDEVFGWLADGRLKVHIGGRYPLEDAGLAHRDLETRRTMGKLLLLTD